MVHAAQISSIYFYEKTVKKLSEEDKNKYHIENMIAADGLVDKNKCQTHEGLKQGDWMFEKDLLNRML